MNKNLQACFHCGETVPSNCLLSVKVDGENQAVCCSGCEAVAKLILQSGQARYYQFRTENAVKPIDEDMDVEQAWQRFDQRQSLWGSELKDGRYELLLQVEGIRCAACAWLIRTQLESRKGVDQVQVDINNGFLRVNWRPALLRLSKIAAILASIGYRPHLPLAGAEATGRQRERRAALKRVGVAGLGMMQVMMYAVALYAGEAQGISQGAERFLQWVSLIVTTPVLIYSGQIFYASAWRSIRSGRVGMDVPVALAISIAFIMSCVNFLSGHGHVYFDSVVMFIFFLSLGRYAELVIRHRNLQTGLALARLLPEWAELLTDENAERVPAIDLRSNDRVRVRAGQTFPADGYIIDGDTEVNEALLTGESRSVVKHRGEDVIAGSINQSQTVVVRVSRDPEDSTISMMGRMLLKSQTHRSRYAQLSDRYAGWFVSVVLTLAGLTAWWWMIHDASMAFPATLAVLVISCPCALSLATPAAIASASRALLERGVLLTRGTALEMMAGIDTIVFDKTGTLTTGQPTVVRTVLDSDRGGIDAAEALRIAALLEVDSSHPVAHAFAGIPVNRTDVCDVVNQPIGVQGRVGDTDYKLGNALFTNTNHAPLPGDEGALWLSDQEGWIARFDLDDGLREDVASTIESLERKGLELIILSGDAPHAVGAIARRIGLYQWHAEQSPQMKMDYLAYLQASGKKVLMVGDGINDALVLSVADVSMTVSGATELANSAADFILTGDSLSLVNDVFATAAMTRRVIKQNLIWALAYNLLAIPFAAAGLIEPWMAAIGMSLSSLVVVLNSGRLARWNSNLALPDTGAKSK